MAKTVPTSATVQDPNLIRPGRPILSAVTQDTSQFSNFLYAAICRQNILHYDAEEHGLGDGIWQGTGSNISTTADGATYVERLRTYYVSRAIPDNHNLIKVQTVATADTADGGVKVEFAVVGGAVIDTVTHTVTFGGSEDLDESTIAGGALDGDTAYHVIVSVMAGVAGWTKLLMIDIDEINITAGSMP